MASDHRRPGRPMKLDQPHRTTPDGRTVTISEAIVQSLRAGNYVETAAHQVGIHKATIYDWLKVGARVNQRFHQGARRSDFTRKELACAEFSDAVAQAQAEAESADVAQLARLARGGHSRTVTTTTTDSSGGTTTQVRTEVAEPNAAVLMWRLERRFADRWGRQQRVELTGADGGPVELTVAEKRSHLLDVLEGLAQRMATADEGLPLPATGAPELVDVQEVG